MKDKTPTENKHLLACPAKIKPSIEGFPVSAEFDDFYYSTDNALAEKHYVFIEHNHIVEKFKQEKSTFTIAEVGFGTGLNFFLTLKEWLNHKNPQAHLRYIAFEKYPLTQTQLQQAANIWPELQFFSDALIKVYPDVLTKGFHHLEFKELNVSLTLVFDDIETGLQSTALSLQNNHKTHNTCAHMGFNQTLINVWFFDGFSPSKNTDMWTQHIFDLAANLSHKNTSYATFTSASKVRKNLVNAGFNVKKVPGYGLKREMILGQYQGSINSNAELQPENKKTQRYRKKNSVQHVWHLIKKKPTAQPCSSAIVIGAGLAGAHIANALAKRNITVTVIDKAPQVAMHASGNSQGVVYSKLSAADDALSQFNLQAQLFADRFYRNEGYYDKCGNACSIVHLATTERERKNYQQFVTAAGENTRFTWHENIEEITGVKSHLAGLHVSGSGWLNPKKLCEQLLAHPNIQLQLDCNITKLSHSGTRWQAHDHFNNKVATADTIIVSTAYEAKQFEQTRFLNVKTIRGQVTELPVTTASQQLKTVLCGHGYIAPAQQTPQGLRHCVGATFNLNDASSKASLEDQNKNLDNLIKMAPELCWPQQGDKHTGLTNRVAFRTATPDYFPIVGAVPKQTSFCDTFGYLRKRAGVCSTELAEYHNGLFINIGYGSRGLAYAPIATSYLLHAMLGEPLPISLSTALQLHPGRFLFRSLVRNQI